MNPLDMHNFGDATLESDHQIGAGDHNAPTDQLIRRKVVLLRLATRTLRRLQIDEADLDAEGAVDLAFFQLYQFVAQRAKDEIAEDQFLKLMAVIIRRVVRDRMRRSWAYKRTGPFGDRATGAQKTEERDLRTYPDPTFARRRRDLELDELISPDPPVDDLVATKLEFEAFLEQLPDDLHRAVLRLRYQGHSIRAIALLLNVTRRTIERKLSDNQRAYHKWKFNR